MHTLLRFLKARKFDIDLATEMFVNSAAWRKSFGAEDIMDTFTFDEVDSFIEFYPQGYHKTDKMVRIETLPDSWQRRGGKQRRGQEGRGDEVDVRQAEGDGQGV